MDRADAQTILKGAKPMTPRELPNEYLGAGLGLPPDVQQLIVNGVRTDGDAIAIAAAFATMSAQQQAQGHAFQLAMLGRDMSDSNKSLSAMRKEFDEHRGHCQRIQDGESKTCRPLDNLKLRVAGYVAVATFICSAIWAIVMAIILDKFTGGGK